MKQATIITHIVFFVVLVAAGGLYSETEQATPRKGTVSPPPSIEDHVSGMQKLDGFMPLYWDDTTGKLWMEISRFDTEVLYAKGLTAGLGSNDIGLDRGQNGGSRVVRFERVGPKILMVQPNYSFRAKSDNPAEVRAVEDAFARSVLWGFAVAAETGGRVLVDATGLFLRDATNAGPRMGNYRVDPARSAIHMPQTKVFPKNTEVDVIITFARQRATPGLGNARGPRDGPTRVGTEISTGTVQRGRGSGLFTGTVASVAPSADSVTLRQHHSFVELPGPGYRPRRTVPGDGYGGMLHQDYAVPLGESLSQRWVRRHRLEKVDPSAQVSDVVKPIVYYLDPGTPEPMRSALLEGANWWNEAFEAAGFRNAFRIEMLPDDADPMDIRYNVINWVHRSTRGWSSGSTVVDPRTGEIIKAIVTLGSLRVRHDYLIFEGLLSPYEKGTESPAVLAETALARLRQLSVHEVGHTLGLSHNYYNSTKGRISVMDYPHPLEKLRDNGTIDLSDAYDIGVGEWDKVTIEYGYQHFPEGVDEEEALGSILNEAWKQDLRFMSNQDMNVSPKTDWWNNGRDVVSELNRLMAVRRAALDRMGESTIKKGAPMATIEEALVPVYLYHRWAVQSAASVIGGQDYIYSIRGDGREPFTRPSAERQRASIEALTATLEPSELAVPKAVIDRLPPRPMGFGAHRELFPRNTGSAFDVLAPAAVASDITIGFVLEPDRAARVVGQNAIDSALPGLEEVIDLLTDATFEGTAANRYEEEILRTTQRVLTNRLMWLAGRAPLAQVRAIALLRLEMLQKRLADASLKDEAERAHRLLLASDISRFMERPSESIPPVYTPVAPPGAPIGGDMGMDWLAPVVWDCMLQDK
jgi:hypothetical protein